MRNTATTVLLVLLVGVLGFTATGLAADAGTDHAQGRSGRSGGRCGPACAARMSSLDETLSAVTTAVEGGNKESALAELKKLRTHVEALKGMCPAGGRAGGESTASAAEASAYVNTHCPIMTGSKIGKDVKPDLIREWKGQKIAFCCKGCPERWDKMTDEQKQAAIDKVTPKPDATPAPTPGEGHGGHSGRAAKGGCGEGGCCPGARADRPAATPAPAPGEGHGGHSGRAAKGGCGEGGCGPGARADRPAATPAPAPHEGGRKAGCGEGGCCPKRGVDKPDGTPSPTPEAHDHGGHGGGRSRRAGSGRCAGRSMRR